MRKITYCLILFLFIYPLSLMADNGLNESVLKELDRVIEEKYSFHVHKEKEIDEIRLVFTGLGTMKKSMNSAVRFFISICIIRPILLYII